MFAGAGQFLITAEKGGVARAKGEGEKEKECTTECKSRDSRCYEIVTDTLHLQERLLEVVVVVVLVSCWCNYLNAHALRQGTVVVVVAVAVVVL